MSSPGRGSIVDDPLLDLDRFAREGAPHRWLAERRAEAPLWRHPSRPGEPAVWAVLGYDEVVELGRCPHVLSSDQQEGGIIGLGPGDELECQLSATAASVPGRNLRNLPKMLLSMDPPEHTGYRKIVNRGFTPRQIAALAGQVRHLIDDLLDQHPLGEAFDFTTEISMPLPVNVISRMIGSPPESDADLLRWSNEALASTDPEYSAGSGTQLMASMQLIQHFAALRQERESTRSDDLISVLLDAEIDGERLSDERFMLFLMLLTAAGNETTRTAFSHAIVELARRPEQWQRLREDRSLVPSAVEEILRYSSPLLYFRRNAVTDLEVGGQRVAAGDIVGLWYVSANRDEEHFSDPQAFDIGRHPNRHVAFGGGGPHFCLGASLARLEIQVLLEALLDRTTSIELAGPIIYMRSNFLNGIKHAPVVLR